MAEDDEHLAYGDNPHGEAEEGFFSKLGNAFKETFSGDDEPVEEPSHVLGQPSVHRYGSFAGPQNGNDVKWYVDGCGYFWAVSVALEQAKESVWILDWWLSPEFYLRRPPAKHEQYRLDRMLQAAAERGVKVNIIVYKEVAAALTRKILTPTLPEYLMSLLPKGQRALNFLCELGIRLTFHSLEQLEKEYPLIVPPVSVDSEHTKHALEALHPNIAVFRHPDHAPRTQVLQSSFATAFENLKLDASTAASLPVDALKGLYGMSEDTVLFWAHHEKLCLIDGNIAFMGGLDMCFGRWDTNQHQLADAHPGNLQEIIWPGQDYNNCRIMDFATVSRWEENKLDRTSSCRAGWSDVSIGIRGPVINDLRDHFVQRWNFIYDEKYNVREDTRYYRLDLESGSNTNNEHNPISNFGHHISRRLHQAEEDYLGIQHERENVSQGPRICQLVRSASKWSHNIETEHSIASAYATLIKQASHFIYIENQFFITATGNQQNPVKNTIGAAIVERVIRAAENGQPFKIFVVIPAVPGFAGDLKDEGSLGTRAIMEFQYNSICRGEHSIREKIIKAGYEPDDYIRFYNLRNYDRINTSSAMKDAEAQSGIDYNAARRQADEQLGGYGGAEEDTYGEPQQDDYNKYQHAAEQIDDREGLGNTRWDSVAECYMLNGTDIRDVPWEDGDTEEIDAFVSEELYVHSKVMIVDDRIVVCGSANINDRSQLGNHDSEIALVIEDEEMIDAQVDGHDHQVSKFATSLRRFLMRKHLGLVPVQGIDSPNHNFMPPGSANEYDFGSEEDEIVADPLAECFLELWNGRAKTNTEAFAKVFRPVPDDRVHSWTEYGEYFEKYFHDAEEVADGKEPSYVAKTKWGHVVKQDFAEGPDGAREVKDILSTIKGSLVEMPLNFLKDEDIAKEGFALNALTEEIYT